MNEYVFLYKIKDSDDRDCVAYVENKTNRFVCDHYFSGVNLNGACYCGRDFEPYNNIITILTEHEYNDLIHFSEQLKALGYGIKKGDKRYLQGVELCHKYQYIFDKLNSIENKLLFLRIQVEEMHYLMYQYDLTKQDVKDIYNQYSLDYQDRGIMNSIYEDEHELGYEAAFSLGIIDFNSDLSRYFDFEKFGEDLLSESDNYYKLKDGRVICLNY